MRIPSVEGQGQRGRQKLSRFLRKVLALQAQGPENRAGSGPGGLAGQQDYDWAQKGSLAAALLWLGVSVEESAGQGSCVSNPSTFRERREGNVRTLVLENKRSRKTDVVRAHFQKQKKRYYRNFITLLYGKD